MINLPSHIRNNTALYRQLNCSEALFTIYNCPLQNKFEDVWSNLNYVVYVVRGRKIWHTNEGSYDLTEGSCVLVRKGATIVEQFIESEFCFYLFFIPDNFIRDVLNTKSIPIANPYVKPNLLIPIANGAQVQTFFNSMSTYFDAVKEPDPSLLEIKFKELILMIADNPNNSELLTYFCSIINEPNQASLQQVMENNFSYNLKLEEYASLCARSLSSFKRDFQKIYHVPPGKWLLERRLHYAHHLLNHAGKTVAEAAFESGFEDSSHFSRAFRIRFGSSPISVKQQKNR